MPGVGRGVVAVVAGTGIASAHLAKAGLDAAAVLAVIVLVSAVILLGWGTAVLVRAGGRYWPSAAVAAL